jgi:putative copper export protein
MSALRFVSLVALAIWLGGMIAIGGVAAPAAFAVLDPSRAATLVGEILRRFHLVSYGAAAIMLVSFTVMALVGPRPRLLGARLVTTSAMLAAMLVSGLWVDRRIAEMRHEIGAPISSLPEGDDRRAAFGRLHGMSTLLMLAATIGGVVLVYWEARDPR